MSLTSLHPAAAALADLPEEELRAAISRLAMLTPEAIYHPIKLAPSPEADDRNEAIPALCLIAAHGPGRIGLCRSTTFDFEDLLSPDGQPMGSWKVIIERQNVPAASLAAGEAGHDEAQLAALDPQDLRQQLAALADTLFLSLFAPAGFELSGGPADLDEEENPDALAKAALLLCAAMNPQIKGKQAFTLGCISCLHGVKDACCWAVTVQRTKTA